MEGTLPRRKGSKGGASRRRVQWRRQLADIKVSSALHWPRMHDHLGDHEDFLSLEKMVKAWMIQGEFICKHCIKVEIRVCA